MLEKAKKLHNHPETAGALFIIFFMSLFILSNLAAGFVWPLYLLAMAVGFGLSVKYPRSGLFAIVFLTMIFERFFTLQSFFVGKIEYKLYPLDILMLGMILGTFRQYSAGFIEKAQLRKADYVLLLFIFLNFIYFISGVFIFKADGHLAFSTLKNYGFYALLYFLATFLIRRQSDLKKLFKFFLAGAIGIIAFILIGIFRGEGLWSEFTPLSTSGVRILAFTHGLYLALAVFPIILYSITREGKQKKWPYVLLAAWFFGIAGTMMRHLWIAVFAVICGLYFFFDAERRREFRRLGYRLLLPILAAAIIVLYTAAMSPRSALSGEVKSVFGSVFERAGSLASVSRDESYSWRSLVWNSAYGEFKKNPLAGIGTGKKIYAETQSYKDFIEVRNIHNSYLSVLIQLGLIGFSLFAGFLYLNVKNLFHEKNADIRRLSILSFLGVYLIALNFQPYLETNLLAVFFWITLGLSRNYYENSGNKQI